MNRETAMAAHLKEERREISRRDLLLRAQQETEKQRQEQRPCGGCRGRKITR